MTIRRFGKSAAIALLVFGCGGVAQAQQSGMTFFVTGTGSGKGADFGGLSGADKHCQTLATAAGAGNLRQLDQERGGRRDGRASRSHGARH